MDKYVKALQELEEAKNSFAHCEAIQLRRQAAGKEPADKKTLVCCCK